MFTRIHSTAIIVKDQEAALEFWGGVLGFEKRLDADMGGMRFLTVAPPGSATELVLGTTAMYANGSGVVNGISFIVDDVDAMFADLSDSVAFIGEPSDMPWGARGISFHDPDGNMHFVSTE
ncbi:MAG: bleomycin resistance protein [Nocardioidaceae bacterium]|nr:bleomycin resistance protein [Nocardioidaceae bacterium]